MKSFAKFMLPMFVVLLLATAACADKVATVVDSQKNEVIIVPEKHLLTGESTFTFSAVGKKAEFLLTPDAVIDKVLVGKNRSTFAFRGGRLSVVVPDSAKIAPVTVRIFYSAVFSDQVPMHPVNMENPAYGINGIITGQEVYLGSEVRWYPTPSVTPAHRITAVSAPAGMEAVTAGKRVARSTSGGISRSIWEEHRPIEELSLSAGPYRIDERNVDGIDIYAYFFPENASLSSRYLDAAVKYIRMYKELLGPYPFEKFAVVENFLPTGYAFPSYTLLGSRVIQLPFIIETSFPHEIAHNWFGNGVLVDYSEGNWSEGLTTYLADYLMKEKKSDAAARDYRFNIISDYAALVAPDQDFALNDFSSRLDPVSRAIGYGKSAMLFHMVRKKIGDEAFFQALRDIINEKLYETASWSDFTRAFSKSSGRDLGPFINQWLMWEGGPRLALSEVTTSRRDDAWSVSGKIVQSRPIYQLSVPLSLETARGSERFIVDIKGENTDFSITVPDFPQRLMLDPQIDLFRLLQPEELPPTVNRLKGSDKLLVVLSKSCKASRENVLMLLESLGQQNSELIQEEKLNDNLLRQHDLLFCGVPEDNSLYAPPAHIAISDKGFSIGKEQFKTPDDLLLLVQIHPLENRQISALFFPLSDGAAIRNGPRIGHYGAYGYLAFGGKKTLKGNLPAAETGSISFSPKALQ